MSICLYYCLSDRRELLLSSRAGSKVLATVPSEVQNYNFKSQLNCEDSKRNTSLKVMKRENK
jgi:hypothetical protein